MSDSDDMEVDTHYDPNDTAPEWMPEPKYSQNPFNSNNGNLVGSKIKIGRLNYQQAHMFLHAACRTLVDKVGVAPPKQGTAQSNLGISIAINTVVQWPMDCLNSLRCPPELLDTTLKVDAHITHQWPNWFNRMNDHNEKSLSHGIDGVFRPLVQWLMRSAGLTPVITFEKQVNLPVRNTPSGKLPKGSNGKSTLPVHLDWCVEVDSSMAPGDEKGVPKVPFHIEYVSQRSTGWQGWSCYSHITTMTRAPARGGRENRIGLFKVMQQVERHATAITAEFVRSVTGNPQSASNLPNNIPDGPGAILLTCHACPPTHLVVTFWNFKTGKIVVSPNLVSPFSDEEGRTDDSNDVGEDQELSGGEEQSEDVDKDEARREQLRKLTVDAELWEKYFNAVTFLAFAWLVGVSPTFKEKWTGRCHPAVERAEKLYQVAGEALQSTRTDRVVAELSDIFVFSWQWLSMQLFKLLAFGISFRSARRIAGAYGIPGVEVEFIPRSRWGLFNFRFLNLVLSPQRVAGDLKQVYMYPDVGVVIKVFPDSERSSYQVEKDFYESCSIIQGQATPRLIAAGTSSDQNLLLVVSYVGQSISIEDMYDLDREARRSILAPLHDLGWHHHDIWEGNIVRDDHSGKPFLVDFELAERVADTASPGPTDVQDQTVKYVDNLGHVARQPCQYGDACPDLLWIEDGASI